jgi:predicted kinase
MSDIVIIGGPPGTGKTLLARGLAAEFPLGVHLEADRFFHFISSGYITPWRPESDTQNHVVNTAVARAASAYAHGGYTVIVDGINGPWFLDYLLANLEPLPSSVHYVIVCCDPDVAVERIHDRPEHTISDAAVRFMHERFAAVSDLPYQRLDTTALSAAQTLGQCRTALDAGELRLDR